MSPQDTAVAFERYRAEVEGLAASILRDRAEARDVASEVYLALLERGPDDPVQVRSWLLASARNRSLNRVRDRANERRKGERAARAEPDAAPPDGLGDDAAADLIRRALGRLGDRDRRAVEMRFVQGRSHDEVAAALGVSAAQARVIAFRAARRLRGETVRLLAAHHGASAGCVSRLVRRVRAHDACAPCAAVVDEVAALGSFAIAPLVVVAQRWAARFAEARARLPRSNGRLSEALAATIVAGALAAHPLGPAAAAHEPDARRAGTVTARNARIASAPRVAAAAAAGRAGAVLRSIERVDPARDTTVPLSVSGVPLLVPDALDLRLERGADVRSVGIATLADARGRPAALRFRIDLDGAVARNAYYSVGWSYDDGCWVDLAYDTFAGVKRFDARTWFVVCPSDGLLTSMSTSKEGARPFDVSVRGSRIELTIAFAGMGEEAAYFTPGRVLRGISVYTAYVNAPQDRAPDDAQLDYTI